MVLVIFVFLNFKLANCFGASGLITGTSLFIRCKSIRSWWPGVCTTDQFSVHWTVQSGHNIKRSLIKGGGTGDFWDSFNWLPEIEPGMEGHSNGGFSDVPNWEIPKAPPKIKPAVSSLLFPDLYKMPNKKRNQARVLRTISGNEVFRTVRVIMSLRETLIKVLKFRYIRELWHACPTSFGREEAMINPLTGEDYNGRFYQGRFFLVHVSGLNRPCLGCKDELVYRGV